MSYQSEKMSSGRREEEKGRNEVEEMEVRGEEEMRKDG